MERRELVYRSSDGAKDVHAYTWLPDKNVKPLGIVQICHGLGEYAEVYTDFAEFLTGHGFIACANDHLGHGKTASGVYGHFGDGKGYRLLVRDVYKLRCLMKKEYPELPYVLFGHCMGSFIARYACSLWGMEFDGAIYSGTGMAPKLTRLLRVFYSVSGKLAGGDSECRLFRSGLIKEMNRYYDRNGSGGSWLTRDEEVLARLREDPQFGFHFTYDAYRDLMKLYSLISGHQWAERVPRDLPVLIFSGAEDPIGHYGKGVRQVHDMLTDVGCEDVQMKLYEGGRHNMLFELNKQEVFDDILNWMIEKVLE